MAASHTLQRLVFPATAEISGLYLRHEGAPRVCRSSADMPAGGALDLDTYFNSFDENIWLRHTRLKNLSVELEIDGAARVELWRHSRHAPGALLCEASTPGGEIVFEVPGPPHQRGGGRLALRIIADRRASRGVRLLAGRWATSTMLASINLMLCICTFDRDGPLCDVLSRLGKDQVVLATLGGIVIVNNGPPGLRRRLSAASAMIEAAGKLYVFEQANVGGAGGFTRGALEARALDATHIIFMDDDVILEPEAVFRTIRLYELAHDDIVVAGHMLDSFRPTHLYEAGARLDDSKLATIPLHLGAELSHPGALGRFLENEPMHYNGWWFMGLPIRLFEKLGYPMPCFIRGDDVEFGRRLHDAGIAMVAMAGVGIWHEPFYAKLGSWHIYYEFRNMCVLAACHIQRPSHVILRTALKWILAELLIFRYQRAALLMRATEDFLRGPALFKCDPALVHASIQNLRKTYPVEAAKRERVIQRRHPERGPVTRLGFAMQMLTALFSEWFRRDDGQDIVVVDPVDHVWFRVRRADGVAVREAWETDQPLYRRSRKSYRSLLLHLAKLTMRFWRLSKVSDEWRKEHANFTGEAAWRNYLGLPASSRASIAVELSMKEPETVAADTI